MNYIKKIKLRVYYASFVALSKEVGHDGMVAVNKRLPQLLVMRDSGNGDNELINGLLEELCTIKKQEIKSNIVYALNWIIKEVKLFQEILNIKDLQEM